MMLYTSHLLVLYICFPLASSWPIFNGKGGFNGTVQRTIRSCVSNYTDETLHCYAILDCLVENMEPAITQRWSAGASILAFTPTVLVLMSNSLDEIVKVAENSPTLAILLCLSSVTPFVARFGFVYRKHPRNRRECHVKRAQQVWDDIEDRLYHRSTRTRKWWQNRRFGAFGLYTFLLGLSVVIWYCMFDVMKYGVMVFACGIKYNPGIWIGATQAIGILNILCRRHLFDMRIIECPQQAPTLQAGVSRASLMTPGLAIAYPRKLRTTISRDDLEDVLIILRSPRTTKTRWILQILTAIFTFGLFAYGTVVFASSTLYVASDATRVFFGVTISAGIGKLVVSLLGTTSVSGKRIILLEISPDDFEDISVTIQETVRGMFG